MPPASRQIAFHQRLAAARKTHLIDALRETVAAIEDVATLRRQLGELVPSDAHGILARAGIREELVFPVPIVLEASPQLVGYYRLLLGVPQKSFYAGDTGLGRLKKAEERGVLGAADAAALPAFCRAMCDRLAELARQISPSITLRDVEELPILTLGSQLQGGNNNTIGKQATEDVFRVVTEIAKEHITSQTARQPVVTNAAGREVTITLASDPDIRIDEVFGDQPRARTAIEIKGGTDVSNAHNRAGEAEKSHIKARGLGYRDFWTLIAKKGLDVAKLQSESPTTTLWFDATQVLARAGPDWDLFRTRLAGDVGIPI